MSRFHDLVRIGDKARLLNFLSGSRSDVNERDEKGRTPLHIAALYGHIEIAEMLIRWRSAVNAQDDFGLTSLHMAAFQGHTGIVRWLLSNGASPDLRDHSGKTAKDLAEEYEKPIAAQAFNTSVTPRRDEADSIFLSLHTIPALWESFGGSLISSIRRLFKAIANPIDIERMHAIIAGFVRNTQENDRQIKDIENQIASIDKRIREGEQLADTATVEELKQERNTLAAEVSDLRTENAHLKLQIQDFANQRAALQEEKNRAERAQNELKEKLEKYVSPEVISCMIAEKAQLASRLDEEKQYNGRLAGEIAKNKENEARLQTNLNSQEATLQELRLVLEKAEQDNDQSNETIDWQRVAIEELERLKQESQHELDSAKQTIQELTDQRQQREIDIELETKEFHDRYCTSADVADLFNKLDEQSRIINDRNARIESLTSAIESEKERTNRMREIEQSTSKRASTYKTLKDRLQSLYKHIAFTEATIKEFARLDATRQNQVETVFNDLRPTEPRKPKRTIGSSKFCEYEFGDDGRLYIDMRHRPYGLLRIGNKHTQDQDIDWLKTFR